MPFTKTITNEKLESIFQPILGEPLTYMMRYFGCQRFDFGIQHPTKSRRGKDYTYSSWRLAVSCNWCITGAEGKIVSSEDFGPGDKRHDESAYPFYDSLDKNPPHAHVEQVQVDDSGNLRLVMTNDVVLEVVPNHPTGQEQWTEFSEPLFELFEEGEQWRFVIDAHNKNHYDDAFVMTLRGLIEFRHRHVEEFFEAVRKNDLLAVEALLKQGMKPWRDPDSGESTMKFAITKGSREMVRLLLQYGGLSISTAVRDNQIENVCFLVELGGDVNAQDTNGWTPLMEAVSLGNLGITQFLVEQGADINLQTKEGETAFLIAVVAEDHKIIEYLQAFNSIRFEKSIEVGESIT